MDDTFSDGRTSVAAIAQGRATPNVASRFADGTKARNGFGKLLRRVEEEQRSLVIEKRGTPRAVLLSIRDYVRLAAPEPEILRVLGEESKKKGTDVLRSEDIDKIIRATRAKRSKRR
jgi:prevent-host-death family protein